MQTRRSHPGNSANCVASLIHRPSASVCSMESCLSWRRTGRQDEKASVFDRSFPGSSERGRTGARLHPLRQAALFQPAILGLG